ncbi:MAG: RluA family pseudouridine synthase [Oscillospiraceae bacterium]|nr:RluA family pseudouridine synthase [Oscillospiraceae bacterium]
MKLTHIAQRDAKLLSFLRQELGLSSTLVKRIKFRQAYRVNGVAVRTNHPVKKGDFIEVCLDEPTPEYPAQEGKLDILYEDDWLIALDKPAGILMHPSSCRNEATLANYLLGYYQKTGQACAVHPVSRLDRDTFGIVLLAKNAHAHAKMMALAQGEALQKVYHALVFGRPREGEGRIDAPIARREGSSLLRCIRADGKAACSAFRVLETRGQVSKLELKPLTGRTHQLRLHCAHAGFPILGDPQYGSESSQAFSAGFQLPYQQLCAVSLAFPHPIERKFLQISSAMDVSLDFLSPKDI